MMIRVLSGLALLMLVAGPAHAVTTYSYVGGHFGDWPWGPGTAGVYTTADSVSGSFTVADGFVPGDPGNGGRTAIFLGQGYDGVLAYSFTDGHQTLTRANSTATIELGILLPIGDVQWGVFIDTPTGGHIHTALGGGERGDNGSLDANNWGWNTSGMIDNAGGRGTWSVSVPEPMSLLLALAGLGGVALARRRSRLRRVLSFLALLVLLAAPAQAITTYIYTGNDFGTGPFGPNVSGVYSTTDRVTGSFTVADGFAPGFSTAGAVFTGIGVPRDANGAYGPETFMDGVIDYSFSDGHQTLTKANSTALIALAVPIVGFAHDLTSPWPSDFQPGTWIVGIQTLTDSVIVTAACQGCGDRGQLNAENFGLNERRPGTWTARVPEPMSLLLVGAGIGSVAVAAARRNAARRRIIGGSPTRLHPVDRRSSSLA
jgi:hypothetical protein